MSELDRIRDEKGKLPAIAWPGGYSIRYLTGDGEPLCADCANGGNGSEATTTHEPGDDEAWHLINHFVHWEGADLYCSHCDENLPSEYGDPEDPGESAPPTLDPEDGDFGRDKPKERSGA